MSNRIELAQEILKFLDQYAGRDQGDDPEVKWSSPDASEMECAAQLLQNEKIEISKIDIPHSSYDSGGYKPVNSLEVKQIHDLLKDKLRILIQESKPL